jgi:hypothetical protein
MKQQGNPIQMIFSEFFLRVGNIMRFRDTVVSALLQDPSNQIKIELSKYLSGRWVSNLDR